MSELPVVILLVSGTDGVLSQDCVRFPSHADDNAKEMSILTHSKRNKILLNVIFIMSNFEV